MEKGKVKWFSEKKGWGFIRADSEAEYFVHWRDIKMDGRKVLQAGEVVEFEVGEDADRNLHAVNVWRLS